MRRVQLFVPTLRRHDAVGEHTRALRDHLQARGVTGQIYTEVPDPTTAAETRHYLDYEAEAEVGDVLVYQFATESEMTGWLVHRPEPLVLNYHGITPPEFFGPWNNTITQLQDVARRRLAELAPKAALGIADSHFIAEELRRAGCTSTAVVPVAGVPVPPVEPSPEVLDQLRSRRRGTGPVWLSVGRWAPNKAHHHTIAALFVARHTSAPDTRLTLVGSPAEPSYARALRRYTAELGLADAVDFVVGISDDELAAHYRTADVLVMLSEHEGFGVPLVEAMGHGLPIVAFEAGAVAEVLGDAGILLAEKSPRRVAGVISALLSDAAACDRLVSAGRARFDTLDLQEASNRLVEAVLSVRAPTVSPS